MLVKEFVYVMSVSVLLDEYLPQLKPTKEHLMSEVVEDLISSSKNVATIL